MKRRWGVHVPHRKNTADMPPETLPVPGIVTIPMSMHIGTPARVTVQAGDAVKLGQVIGEASGNVSAPVHASVSGTVKEISEILLPSGERSQAVVIESDGRQTPAEGLLPPKVETMADLLAAARASGAVGLGGAGFPTAVKLSVEDPAAVEAILINGAECEPYITADTRTMMDDADLIVEGAELLRRFYPNSSVWIGIEKNKPKAIQVLRRLCAGRTGIAVRALPSVYPQGGEKTLIYSLTGKIVPEGKLPPDVNVLVLNCTTLAFLVRFIRTGMPLVSKCVTVDGSAVKNPKNILAPIGTPVSALLTHCGAEAADVRKIMMGGPMMGVAIPGGEMPVIKTSNAVLAFKEAEARLRRETACIRCGRCVQVCPMNLMPLEYERAYQLKKPEILERLKVNLCIECGCCAYTCPAKRPLVQAIRLSKLMLGEHQGKQTQRKEGVQA